MRKAIKRIAVLFMVCGLAVSVSFGYGMFEEDEAMYQKLKAEVEEVENRWNINVDDSECFKEDGSPAYDEFKINASESKRYDIMFKARVCKMKNVLAFVDEYRKVDKKELEKELKKFKKDVFVTGYDVYAKVKKVPRFKEDSSIYYQQSIGNLLKESLKKWEEYKMQRTIDTHGGK